METKKLAKLFVLAGKKWRYVHHSQIKKTAFVLFTIGGISFLVSQFTDKSLCIFYNVTGVPCISCGLTRAFKSLFKLDIYGAFFYHPLFFLIPIIPFLLLRAKNENIQKKLNILSIIVIALFITVWIIRLILYFPNEYPMTFNENSIFGNIILIFKN